ncbi:suppressor of cytokine signaling 7 [Cichlidogyrus casuarinus]|uniref:Suppressor of cytokine signaling 7 n=1 Tax=Cichlidogyrus casuarinus TaxID=1844966 RepID=A0ABD2QJ91_9PLAT
MYNFVMQPSNVSGRTIVEFIERAVRYNEAGSYHFFIQSANVGTPAISVALSHPLSRKQIVPKLKHLCRLELRHRLNTSDLDHLRIPNDLRVYLSEPQYFVDSVPEMAERLRDLPALPFTYHYISSNRFSSSNTSRMLERKESSSHTPVSAAEDNRDTPRNRSDNNSLQ